MQDGTETLRDTCTYNTYLDLAISQRHQLPLATPPTFRLLVGAQSTAMSGGLGASRLMMGVAVVMS